MIQHNGCIEIFYVLSCIFFAKQTRQLSTEAGKVLRSWYVSSEQYCCETWSVWTVGRMKYKFINIRPSGQYSVAQELLLVAVNAKTQRGAEHPENI